MSWRARKWFEDYFRYTLRAQHVKAGEVLVVPEGVVLYYSEVFIEGEVYIDGDLKLV